MTTEPHQPQWKRRRGVVFGTLGFCAAVVGYLTGWGADTALSRDIAQGLILLAGAVVGSYVFGAAWDDKNVMAHVERLANGNGKES